MAAVMRIARLASASAHLLPMSEATAVEPIERGNDTFVIRLVKGYQYRFHTFYKNVRITQYINFSMPQNRRPTLSAYAISDVAA